MFDDGCVIDGERYLYTNYFQELLRAKKRPKKLAEPQAGGVICLLLDESGAVAASVAVSAQEGSQYGFLIALSHDKGISGTILARMLTISGDVKILKCKDKVSVDGDPVSGEKLMSHFKTRLGAVERDNVCDVGRVVQYTLNKDGVISRIDTEYFNAAKESEGSSMRCDVAWQTARWSADANSFAGYALKGGRTVLFGKPAAMSGSDSSYGLISVSSLVGGADYKISAYNLSRGGEADVICVEMNVDAPSTINTWDAPYVIEKIVNVINADGDIVQQAYAYGYPSSAEATTLVCQKPGMLDGYQPGDVIRCGLNTKSEVNNIEKVLLHSDLKKPFLSNSNFTTSYWFYYGKVMSWEGNNVCVSFNEDDTDVRYFPLTRPMTNRAHIVYDCARGKAKSMEMADLIGAENSDNPSWILLYAWKGQVMDVIAFNNMK